MTRPARQIRVGFIAKMEHRIDVFMKRNNHGVSLREAERFIKRMDAKRSRWGRTLYNDGHFHPTDFDLVIDPGHMSIADAHSLVAAAVEDPDFMPTPTSLNTIQCMAVAMELRAKISMDADIVDDKIDVEVRDGEIKVSGAVRSPDDIDTIKSLLDTRPEFRTAELTDLKSDSIH